MTFDEKMDEAERLFMIEEKLSFLNPVYGLCASGIGIFLQIIGVDFFAFLVLTTSLIVSIIGIIVIRIKWFYFKKGFKVLSSAFSDMDQATNPNEIDRMISRYKFIQSRFFNPILLF